MVANRLGLEARKVRKLLREGSLPGTRIGGLWYVPKQELENYIVRLRARARSNLRSTP